MQPKVSKLLQSFFKEFKLQSFSKESLVINSANKKIFFLTKGVVKMCSYSREKTEFILNVYKPFAIFPMSLILNESKEKYVYLALTKVEGYFAPKAGFKKFLEENPVIIYDLLKRIYRGLDGFLRRLETLLIKDAYLKVLNQLIIYGKRFGQKSNQKIIFDFHVTHFQLASQTGLARESVTKELKKLQNKGLIGYVGKKLFIYDLLKLEKEYLTYNKITP